MSTLMIYGQQWLPRKYFEKHYAPHIERAFHKLTMFVIGAADGIDTFAQELLVKLCATDENAYRRVTIFNKGDKDGRLSSRFALVNGFATYPDRDVAMFRASTERLCVLAQFGGATSGCTFICLLEHFGGDVDKARDAHNALRRASEPHSETMEKIVKIIYYEASPE